MAKAKLGSGARFKSMAQAIEKTGISKKGAGAIAAAAGRKKYGNAKFQALATAGRKKK